MGAKYLFVFVPLILIGCVSMQPVSVVHKTGSTRSERSLAFDECKVEALKEAPPDLRTTTTEGVHTPGTLSCTSGYGIMTCNTAGGFDVPGVTTTDDLNEPLRSRIIDRCLASKGFDVLDLKRCSSPEAEEKAKRQLDGKQPPASEMMCAPAQQLEQS